MTSQETFVAQETFIARLRRHRERNQISIQQIAITTRVKPELFEALEHWRRVAVLQADRTDFTRVARRAAELLTGEPVPEDEPLSVTRVKAGL